MTTPASGAISVAVIGNEVGVGTGAALDINYLRSLLRSPPATYALSDFYSKAWFQRNVDGNCNNGNCAQGPLNANCGDVQCQNCTIAGINCVNCDASVRLQDNCNCACSYNCTQTIYSYNCTGNCPGG